jgi:hypothetical protein
MVIQESLLAAVQSQKLLLRWTSTAPEPPPIGYVENLDIVAPQTGAYGMLPE